MPKGEIVGNVLCLSLMASTTVKMTGKQKTKEIKLRRNSSLRRTRSTGKRPRTVGSHSEIPTAVGSGEAAQMLNAGVKRREEVI